MKSILLLLTLFSATAFSQQGIVASYLRLTPTLMPIKCNLGDVRADSLTTYFKFCSPANTWNIVPFGTTLNGAFNLISPMTTGGDIIYGGALGVATRLANGSSGQVLTSNGTTLAPSWQAPSGNVNGLTSTATAAGTTTLTNSSTTLQFFTGSTTQTMVLPAATTLSLGQQYNVFNNSTGAVTVEANGASVLIVMGASSSCLFTVTNIGSGAGTWQLSYVTNTNLFTSSVVTGSASITNPSTWTTWGNSPALTFTPAITGLYKVYSNFIIINNSTGNGFVNTRIINTSGGATLLAESQSYGPTSNASAACSGNVNPMSTYTLTAGTSYVFDIQGFINNSTGGTVAGTNSQFYMFAERLH